MLKSLLRRPARAAAVLGIVALISTITLLALPTQAVCNGTIQFTKHAISNDNSSASAVYATDVDGDGDTDVLGGISTDNTIVWWENDGSQAFTKHTLPTAAAFSDPLSVFATDVDGDGDIDVLGAAGQADDITWWENDGAETFTEHTIAGTFDGANSVYATDLDDDGDIDVLGAASNASDITWWENDGAETFTEHTIAGAFVGARSVYATDVDGDSDIDVLGAALSADDITWWENDGAETFTEHTIAGTFDGAVSVYATDVDGDGDIDVLGAATVANDITWWENDGAETFTEHILDSDYSSASAVYAADIDGDGDIDVTGAGSAITSGVTWWEQTCDAAEGESEAPAPTLPEPGLGPLGDNNTTVTLARAECILTPDSTSPYKQLRLTVKPVDFDQVRRLYIRINGSQYDFAPITSDKPDYAVTLPPIPPGTYPYALTVNYGSTTRTEHGQLTTCGTVDVSEINRLFRLVYQRNPSLSEWAFWVERRLEKMALPEFIGALQFHFVNKILH